MLDAAKALWEMLAKLSWVKIMIANLFLLLPFSTIIGLFALLITYADDIHALVVSLVAYLGHTSWGAYYAKINVIIPLNESIGISLLLLQLKLATTAARWIKSWVPTIG